MEAVTQLAPPVQGQRGLANPGWTTDHDDARASGEVGFKFVEVPLATSEVRDGHRELPRPDARSIPYLPSLDGEELSQRPTGAKRVIAPNRNIPRRWLLAILDLAQVTFTVMNQPSESTEGEALLSTDPTQLGPEAETPWHLILWHLIIRP